MRFVRSWLALASLPLAFSACAQPAPSTAGGGISLDQFLSRQTNRIMAADTDGDGKVSRAEMAAMAKNGRDPSRRFDAMDINHDGLLDAGEIRDALTRRFRRLDRNGDGMLTPDERMAGRMRSRQAAPIDPTASPQP
jgi:Ca2+-binding EF-hand superfamily protein